MAHFAPRSFGWLPSLPDFRDYTPGSTPFEELLVQLRASEASASARAASVDLREYFLNVDDQLTLNACAAHACASLVEYFERRAHGHLLRPSRLFLYHNTLRFSGMRHDAGASLRSTLKAMIRCGVPPERHWPYEVEHLQRSPDAPLYSFVEPYRSINYLRLDARGASGTETLQVVKAFLAAGFPSAFGFPVPDSLSTNPDIPYRPTFDSIAGGQTVLAVGYDDRWLRGSRGALLVRSSWGPAWGEEGYGWLPYAYVEEQLAIDFWTLFHSDWISSGEFGVLDLQ